jgi:spore coat protein E
MSSYKEIVTKTVIGKGKKSFNNKYSIDVNDNVSNILGCWIINHKFSGIKENDDVLVNGSFDVNIWYSYDNDTKTNVINETISYNDLINIKSRIKTSNDSEIIVKALKQPECIDVEINNKTIDFNIEKELGIEVVGDEKIKILTEDNEDDWQNLNDLDDNVSKDIDNVNENNII